MTNANYTCHELVYNHFAEISHVKRAMFQITCALYHLHSHGICHRDLKPGNFLCYYDNGGILTTKLTDFGMTKPLNLVNRNSLHAGTIWYRAPELVLKNRDSTFSMDIWSLACSFFELVARKPLFKANSDIDLIQLIFQKLGSPNPALIDRICPGQLKVAIGTYKRKSIRSQLNLSPNNMLKFNEKIVDNLYNPGNIDEFCDLLDNMLQFDPLKRLTIDQVIKHPFFSGFFEQNPRHFDLWVPKLDKIKVLIPTPIFPKHKYWKYGSSAFTNINEELVHYDDEIYYSIRFHGLDIYNRFLLRIEEMDNKDIYIKLAWVSGYIASKFFLDELSAHLWDLFPESPANITHTEIVSLERMILQILDFEIYRKTFYTLLEYRAFYAPLFALLIQGNILYGRRLDIVMKIFNENVKQIVNK